MNVNVFSMSLKRTIDCTVILPQQIANDEKLSCMWLYHGSSGNHKAWLYHAPMQELSDQYHIAFVLPNVNESCFVDMNIGDSYGRYVGRELPSIIWNMFACISKEREKNFIAGFSNGGYGCFHTALTYPKKYCAIGAFSAGDKADAVFENDNSAKSIQRIRLFGAGDLHDTDYSIIHLAHSLIRENVEKPVVYHACGGKDPWLSMNHIVRDAFQQMPEYDYTYDEIAHLGHEWEFWREELNRFLQFLCKKGYITEA